MLAGNTTALEAVFLEDAERAGVEEISLRLLGCLMPGIIDDIFEPT